ncbi:MAG: hypothetical protein O2856_03800, partial [Planctomycetota bacterium]|nr:hypothetical protein [Planctomycetota bacterium]
MPARIAAPVSTAQRKAAVAAFAQNSDADPFAALREIQGENCDQQNEDKLWISHLSLSRSS